MLRSRALASSMLIAATGLIAPGGAAVAQTPTWITSGYFNATISQTNFPDGSYMLSFADWDLGAGSYITPHFYVAFSGTADMNLDTLNPANQPLTTVTLTANELQYSGTQDLTGGNTGPFVTPYANPNPAQYDEDFTAVPVRARITGAYTDPLGNMTPALFGHSSSDFGSTLPGNLPSMRLDDGTGTNVQVDIIQQLQVFLDGQWRQYQTVYDYLLGLAQAAIADFQAGGPTTIDDVWWHFDRANFWNANHPYTELSGPGFFWYAQMNIIGPVIGNTVVRDLPPRKPPIRPWRLDLGKAGLALFIERYGVTPEVLVADAAKALEATMAAETKAINEGTRRAVVVADRFARLQTTLTPASISPRPGAGDMDGRSERANENALNTLFTKAGQAAIAYLARGAVEPASAHLEFILSKVEGRNAWLVGRAAEQIRGLAGAAFAIVNPPVKCEDRQCLVDRPINEIGGGDAGGGGDLVEALQ